jgi:hypothetical protein
MPSNAIHRTNLTQVIERDFAAFSQPAITPPELQSAGRQFFCITSTATRNSTRGRLPSSPTLPTRLRPRAC